MAKTSQPMEADHSQHTDSPQKPKPTTPAVKTSAVKTSAGKPTQSRTVPIRMGAKRVWNKVRPKEGRAGRGVAKISKLKNFVNDPATTVKQPDYSGKTAHFAPGVPNTAEIRNGYLAPGAKPKKIRGGSTDIGTEGSYDGAAEAQTAYD